MNIEVEYGIGTRVEHFTGYQGIVTAIFIRGTNINYEFTYGTPDGAIKSLSVESCELEVSEMKPLGFKKNGKPERP